MNDNNNYKVGFCKPPVHTRFKPGQSGNPKGRPKGTMDTHRLIDAILNKKVAATIDGVPIRISKRQAMLMRLANNATSGDINSLRLLMPHLFQIDAKKEARARAKAENMSRSDREILDEYLAKGDNNV